MGEHIVTLRVAIKERVYVGETEVYKSTLDTDIPIMCLARPQNELSLFWYSFSKRYASRFILKIFGTYEDNGRMFLVAETFQCTLSAWKGPLLDDNNAKRLDQSFIVMLSDILEGIHFLHSNQIRHGQICAENVYVTSGARAKLGNVVDSDKNYNDDMSSFSKMIRKLFVAKGTAMPIEVQFFLKMCENFVPHRTAIKNALSHPIMLNPPERCNLRILARQNSEFAFERNSVLTRMYNTLPNPKQTWRALVTHPRLLALDAYNSSDDFAGFIYFSRAAAVHVNDKTQIFTYELLDKLLDNIWPGFLSFWFQACLYCNVFLPAFRG